MGCLEDKCAHNTTGVSKNDFCMICGCDVLCVAVACACMYTHAYIHACILAYTCSFPALFSESDVPCCI